MQTVRRAVGRAHRIGPPKRSIVGKRAIGHCKRICGIVHARIVAAACDLDAASEWPLANTRGGRDPLRSPSAARASARAFLGSVGARRERSTSFTGPNSTIFRNAHQWMWFDVEDN